MAPSESLNLQTGVTNMHDHHNLHFSTLIPSAQSVVTHHQILVRTFFNSPPSLQL